MKQIVFDLFVSGVACPSPGCMNIPRTLYCFPSFLTCQFFLIYHYNVLYLHPDPNTLISLLRKRYWILSARSAVRSRIPRCVPCARFNASVLQPIIATYNFPSQGWYPFAHFPMSELTMLGRFCSRNTNGGVLNLSRVTS